MAKVSRRERQFWEHVLSAGLGALDSMRTMLLSELIRKHSAGLTPAEVAYAQQKNDQIADAIRDLRKLTWRIRKSL